MAKKIIDIVNDTEAALTGAEDFEASEKLSRLAVDAIDGGIKSEAWKTYMLQFVEKDAGGNPVNPAQLARLLAEDGTADNPKISRKRAYLVGNAVCGSGSPFTGGLQRRVESIDNGLDGVECNIDGPTPPINN